MSRMPNSRLRETCASSAAKEPFSHIAGSRSARRLRTDWPLRTGNVTRPQTREMQVPNSIRDRAQSVHATARVALETHQPELRLKRVVEEWLDGMRPSPADREPERVVP